MQLNYFIGTIGSSSHISIVTVTVLFLSTSVLTLYHNKCAVFTDKMRKQCPNETTVLERVVPLDFKVMREKPTRTIGSYTECWSFCVETIVTVSNDQAV